MYEPLLPPGIKVFQVKKESCVSIFKLFWKKVFLKLSQNSQENTCVAVFFN